ASQAQASEAEASGSGGASSWLARLSSALPAGVAEAAAAMSAGDLNGLSGAAAVAQKGLQQNFADVTGKAKGLAKNASTTISENAISRQRWTTFFSGALGGVVLMSLAFAFLPMIVFAPQKFALLFTLGSLCFMSSFAALRGHSAFLRHLLSGSRLPFTITYALSMAGTLWASLVYRSYLLTIGFSAIQVSALSWFLVSYIPGGRRALGLVSSMAWRMCKGCGRCASKGSLLPF
ncbi:unnamed protein product, partial [Polarella glacialis]